MTSGDDEPEPGPSSAGHDASQPHHSQSVAGNPSSSHYDSDDSIEIIDIPKKKPVVIVLSDSDEDFNVTQKTKNGLGKGKVHRSKMLSKDEEIRDVLQGKALFETSTSPKASGTTWQGSKETTCSVCLAGFEDQTFCDQCYHSFCFACILQWSKVVRTCPLCKAPFKALIHKITPNLTFQVYKFEIEDAKSATEQFLLSTGLVQFNEQMADGRRFRYRSTLVDGRVPPTRHRQEPPYRSRSEISNRERRRRKESRIAAAEERRRLVYDGNLMLKKLEQRGRMRWRETSAKFFRENPAVKYRIVPWLLRDLNVLLGKHTPHVSFVTNYTLSLLERVEIQSEEFREQLSQFLFDKTDKFISELYNFARAPYDMAAFDDNAVYERPRNEPINSNPIPVRHSDGPSTSAASDQNVVPLSSELASSSGVSRAAVNVDVDDGGSSSIDEMFPFGSTRQFASDDETDLVMVPSGSPSDASAGAETCDLRQTIEKERGIESNQGDGRRERHHREGRYCRKDKTSSRRSKVRASKIKEDHYSRAVSDESSSRATTCCDYSECDSDVVRQSDRAASRRKTHSHSRSPTRSKKKKHKNGKSSRSNDSVDREHSSRRSRKTKHDDDLDERVYLSQLHNDKPTNLSIDTHHDLHDSGDSTQRLRSVVRVVSSSSPSQNPTVHDKQPNVKQESDRSSVVEGSPSEYELVNEIEDLERRIAEKRRRLEAHRKSEKPNAL